MILYIAKKKGNMGQHDLGSVLCLNVLRLLPDNHVEVIECESLRSRPTWLVGTPTLIDEDNGEKWEGHNALTRLQTMSVHIAHEQAKPNKKEGSRPQHPPSSNFARQLPPITSARLSSPPPAEEENEENENENEEVGQMWESTIDENDTEEASTIGGNKLTSDDLSSAMSSRQMQSQHTVNSKPPLPPLTD